MAESIIDISDSIRDPYGKGIIKVGSSLLQDDNRYLLSTAGVVEQVNQIEVIEVKCK